jgi:ankyrin repeat protein
MKKYALLSQFKFFCVAAGFLILSQAALANERLLFQAIEENNINKVADALGTVSDIDTLNVHGDTALIQAARSGNLEIMSLLLKKGANVNKLNSVKRDILNISISRKDPKMARWALENGIDPTMLTSVYEGSALIYACHQAQVEIVEMLIKAGAPLDRVNNLGWTALLETTILGDGLKPYQEIARLLIEAGADPLIADRENRSPIDHATSRGQLEVLEILKRSKHLQ